MLKATRYVINAIIGAVIQRTGAVDDVVGAPDRLAMTGQY
jgi:hypothetical protein